MSAPAPSWRSGSISITIRLGYNGPPYAVVEQVFDEDGIEGCDPAPQERIFDESGKASLVTIARASR
jgi:hypothetical protein